MVVVAAADVFITNGGFGGVLLSLSHGVPKVPVRETCRQRRREGGRHHFGRPRLARAGIGGTPQR